MAANNQIKSLAPLAGTQTRGLTRFARDFSPRITAPYVGVKCLVSPQKCQNIAFKIFI